MVGDDLLLDALPPVAIEVTAMVVAGLRAAH